MGFQRTNRLPRCSHKHGYISPLWHYDIMAYVGDFLYVRRRFILEEGYFLLQRLLVLLNRKVWEISATTTTTWIIQRRNTVV